MPITVYDWTNFEGTPGGRFPGTVGGCMFLDRGFGGVSWRKPGAVKQTEIDWDAYRKGVLPLLPAGLKVCIDIEDEDQAAVAECMVRAMRYGRQARPDCDWGFYAGPHGPTVSGAYNGDAELLASPWLTEEEKACRAAGQTVYQAIYPDWLHDEPDWSKWPEHLKAKLLNYRTGAVLSCRRWWMDRGTAAPERVVPIITGTHGAGLNPTSRFLGVRLIEAQCRVIREFREAALFDGYKFDPATLIMVGRHPFKPVGESYAWQIVNETKAAADT